ncbi:hypothetical protein TIFTF001_037721 [Ficus carica]|uniref:FAD-binding PCMH-type domain-containing protein n=1 Tax=Ficus carica TaxID=3494 RepID=A0AA88E6N0_FICCA|nr:hypothetical protein TIFTF001_037717 [Ficus carica]GMN68666.1 hypothetical protein TIFTF001_037721 [Ficus carica]
MKYFTFFSSSFAKIIIIFLFSILVSASAYTHGDFLHCLSSHVSSSTSTHEPIFYTPNESSYSTVLNSSIQNDRFFSPSTPKPFVIITPFHVSHVQATVYCAKKHGVQIRTRSGGHDYEGLSYVSYFNVPKFVVIDLRNLSSVSVDVESKSAWVQAGATIGELYYAIGKKSENLGFPAGDCHTVGVGGLFGGGGYGYLARKYGLSADNILDAKIVDAEGKILDKKSMGEDLFWAIRGGGPASFGIVVAWKVRLVPVPKKVAVFDVSRNLENDATKKLFHRWQRRAYKVDKDLTVYMTFRTAVSSTIDQNGKNVTKIVLQADIRGSFNGGVDKLLELMQKEFPELGLQRQECLKMKWVESFLFFNFFRSGESLDVLLSKKSNINLLSFKVKSDFVKEPIPNDVFEKMLEMLYEEDVGKALIFVFPFGGKMSEISESAIPFPHRAGNIYAFQYQLSWEKEDEEEKHVNWVRRLYDYLTPYVSKNPRATYFNFKDLDLGTNNLNKGGHTSIKQASIWGTKYFKNNFYRLVHVKTKIDPTNFFTYEQSIPPLR